MDRAPAITLARNVQSQRCTVYARTFFRGGCRLAHAFIGAQLDAVLASMASQADAAWQLSRITSSDASVAGVVLERLDLQGLLEITKPSKIDVLVVRKVDLIKPSLGDERCLLNTRASACRTRTSEQVMGRAVRRSEAHDMVKGKRYAEPLRADQTTVTKQQHAGAYSMACAERRSLASA